MKLKHWLIKKLGGYIYNPISKEIVITKTERKLMPIVVKFTLPAPITKIDKGIVMREFSRHFANAIRENIEQFACIKTRLNPITQETEYFFKIEIVEQMKEAE